MNMSELKAKLSFCVGLHNDAALISIESNCDKMVTDDIYDCGIYDWILYNVAQEIPKQSILSVEVYVKPSSYGNEIDEIVYELISDVKISEIPDSNTIAAKEKLISELVGMLENFRPSSKYDEYGEEIFLGGDFEYNIGSEELGYEVASLLDKHKQSKGE